MNIRRMANATLYDVHGMHMALCVNGTSMFLFLSALALLLFLMFNKDDVVNE